jgi:uncharacterized protein
MSKTDLAQFTGQKYLSLESYRKDGTPVLTPMWFAESNGVFYVYSLAGAGKVKRIRRNPRVRVAPCSVRGKLNGEWVEATAVILDASGARHGHSLLNQKYISKRIGDLFSKLMGRERVVLGVHPDGGEIS